MEAGTQTDLNEEEEAAHYKKAYDNAVWKLLENIYMWDPEAGWDILIETLFKHFARENREKRSELSDCEPR